MVVIDLPVEAAEITVVVEGPARHQRTGFDPVDAAEDLRNPIELGDRYTGQFVRETGAGGAFVLRLAGFMMLIGTEEPETVGDDRPADISAPALFGLDRSDGTVGDVRATHVRAGIFEKGTGLKAVASRLGDDVDGAAGEVAIFDVERRELDLGLADRVVGKRGRAARREASIVEAVNIALEDAVDGEGVAAVIAAETGDAVDAGAAIVAVEADARVDADDVADVAVEGWRVLENVLTERRARPDRPKLHIGTLAGDDDRLVGGGA